MNTLNSHLQSEAKYCKLQGQEDQDVAKTKELSCKTKLLSC